MTAIRWRDVEDLRGANLRETFFDESRVLDSRQSRVKTVFFNQLVVAVVASDQHEGCEYYCYGFLHILFSLIKGRLPVALGQPDRRPVYELRQSETKF